jgi:RNA-directed DNA polymerase
MAAVKHRHDPAWPDWFRPSGYLHFDRRISSPEPVRHRVESPEAVSRHSFLPFIHFKKYTRKYKKEAGGFVHKERPLSIASHLDSLIFRRYADLLSEPYERLLEHASIFENVIAYRKFDPPKCNIHFANEAFNCIYATGTCTALAFDLKDFFESLNHNHLKKAWATVLGVGALPPDHFAVFRAVTQYAYVEQDELYALLGISKKKLKMWRGPICTPHDFRQKVRQAGLIKKRVEPFGIPQGTSLSALLSNIYMLDVDAALAKESKAKGCLYRRYSDDILFVCPTPDDASHLKKVLDTQLNRLGLHLHDGPGKMSACSFTRTADGKLTTDRPLQYLGFLFDGKVARLRCHTLSRFFRRMRKAARTERHLSKLRHTNGLQPQIYKRTLYERFSHLGKRNFVSYAKRSGKLLARNVIGRQIRTHWDDLHVELTIDWG